MQLNTRRQVRLGKPTCICQNKGCKISDCQWPSWTTSPALRAESWSRHWDSSPFSTRVWQAWHSKWVQIISIFLFSIDMSSGAEKGLFAIIGSIISSGALFMKRRRRYFVSLMPESSFFCVRKRHSSPMFEDSLLSRSDVMSDCIAGWMNVIANPVHIIAWFSSPLAAPRRNSLVLHLGAKRSFNQSIVEP